MINTILYIILFIEYFAQQITMIHFFSAFLESRVKKRTWYILSVPLTLAGYICDMSTKLSQYLGFGVLVNYKLFIAVIPEVILIYALTKGKFLKKVFIIILLFGTIFCLDAISVQIGASSGLMIDIKNCSISVRVLCNLFFTLAYFMVTFLINKISSRKNSEYNYKQIIVLIFFFIAQFSLIVLSTHTVASITTTFSISIFVVSFITVIADIVIIQLIEQAGEKGHLEEQIKCIEEIQKGEKDYYNNLVEKEELMSTMRHDWNEQLQTALTLCANDNSEKTLKAKQIISELNESLLKSVPKKFTQNITLNALLNSKSKILEEANINYKFDVKLRETVNIDLINLCSIFSNLINNAYEYTKKNALENNYIELKAKQIDNKIIIKCTNNLKSNEKINGSSNLTTTKSDKKNHGYGLAIIKSLVAKYNGNFNINIENNQFIANLYVIEN